jgi:diguanylate cyclase (GGDEF)-like protein
LLLVYKAVGRSQSSFFPFLLDCPGVHAENVSPMRHRRVWLMWAALVIAFGGIGSTLAAIVVAHNEAQKSRQTFVISSSAIASTLQLAIQHEQDLAAGAGAYFVENPNGLQSAFQRWTTSVGAFERYPEVLGIVEVKMVSASQLPAFAAAAEANPVGGLSPGATFQVVPAGARPFYCLVSASQIRVGQAIPAAGFDYCESILGPQFLKARDSGLGAYVPYGSGKNLILGVGTPAYLGGVVPATVEARQRAFVGWTGTDIRPSVILNTALRGHPETAVAFVFGSGASKVTLRAGSSPAGATSTSIDLHNGWHVRTFAEVTGAGLLDNWNALAVLFGGIALTWLLGILLYVLGTSRSRALAVVSEQTGELRYQALHDGLTGLPNRALILDRIEQLLARGRRQGTVGAALYVDLDEFKNVNDSLGHEAGDRLLIAVAARLQNTLRDADTIGRMGGDEFVVLIDGATLQVAPEMVADRILEVMRQPFELEGAPMPLIVNASIGIAMGDRAGPGDLLRDADVALYQAKAAGKNRYEIFQPEMQTDLQRRIELEFDLRSALDGDQYHLVYQPIYNLDDLRMVGVEALLRWDHPTRGVVGPDEFVPILEQTGQIREVGRWVLDHACQQMAVWRSSGNALDVSVNVSGRQLDDDAIIEHIANALSASGLPAASLIIEVTETALMRNTDATARRLQAIKALGVRIAVDDFGTGYSSLAYLQRFPVDCLKIDQSFVKAIATSPESTALVGTLVQLGRDLGLTTLAEGVETPGQMAHLRGEHVNEVQGFLLARPLEALAFETELLIPTRLSHGMATPSSANT